MMLKAKSSHESTQRQLQRQQGNDFYKLKKSKQVRQPRKKAQPTPPHLNSIASISSKRLHKPSRSTIQPNEQLHYNSPITAYQQNENLQSNAFSFTHILQQNLKNQQPHLNIQASLSPAVTSFQLNQPKTIQIALTNRQTKSKVGIIQEQFLKNHSISKERISMQRDYSFPKKISMEKSLSKSPLRLINPNKINNTPKIKQNKKGRDEQKSFKYILQSKQNEEIRLQCSQKIFKFMGNIESNSLKKKDIVTCSSKSKSNLLSTGIINISQRLDHDKLPSELIKTSKDNISSKSVVESSCNQQIKQFFQEDSSPSCEVAIQDQINQMKHKIIRANYELQRLSKKQSCSSISFLLAHNNPEIDQSKNQQLIQKLEYLKAHIVKATEDIIKNTTKLSRSFVKEIDEYIKTIESSSITQINWLQIEEKIKQSDYLQTIKCQNQILMHRIHHLETQIIKFDHLQKSSYSAAKQYEKIQAQLRDINSKIPKINNFSSKFKFCDNFKCELYSGYFQDINDKIEKMRSMINDSRLFKHSN